MFEVDAKSSVLKSINKLDPKRKERIKEVIPTLKENLKVFHHQIQAQQASGVQINISYRNTSKVQGADVPCPPRQKLL